METTAEQQKKIVCTEATIEELKDAIKNRIPIYGVTMLITHPGAHADEIFTGYQVMETPEGKRLFPGVDSFAFKTQKELKQFRRYEGFYELLQKGYLVIGTGEGLFDEHGNRDNEKSCANIMADYLGLLISKEGRVIYNRFLNYINYEDGKGNGQEILKKVINEFEKLPELGRYTGLKKAISNLDYLVNAVAQPSFADNIKKGWKLVEAGKKDSETLLAEAFGFIRTEIDGQRLFLAGRKEYERIKKQIIDLSFLPKEKNKKPVMLVIESDHPEIVSVARNLFSTNGDMQMKVLLKINSKGQIYLCGMNNTCLAEVVKSLQVNLARKKDIPVPNWNDLGRDGSLHGLEQIYYHKDGNSIFNGSFTQQDVEGIIGNEEDSLTQKELIDAIIEGLTPHFFFKHSNLCKKGICVVKQKTGSCPLYECGFQKCFEARNSKS